MSSGSGGEREREARREFFLRGKREIKCKKRSKVDDNSAKNSRSGGQNNGVIMSLLLPNLQKVYNKFVFLSGWFPPQLGLEI